MATERNLHLSSIEGGGGNDNNNNNNNDNNNKPFKAEWYGKYIYLPF
jgi:hypothetical protein